MENNTEHHRYHQYLTGLIVVTAGVLLLLYRMGQPVPSWIFTWPMLLIAVGFIAIVKRQFRSLFGWLLLAVGGLFLVPKIVPEYRDFIHIAIPPAVLILIGIAVMFRPRFNKGQWKHCRGKDGKNEWNWANSSKSESTENLLDETTVFSGIRKSVISKDFQGGEITTVFGGLELDLTQADIQGVVTLEVTVVFGGIRLTVPPHWEIRNKVTPVAGGVDDKRPLIHTARDHQKVLVLDGEVVFGGIDIRSY